MSYRPLLALLAAICLLAGCAPLYDRIGELRGDDTIPAPVGTGPGQDELYRSPCACIEITLTPPVPPV